MREPEFTRVLLCKEVVQDSTNDRSTIGCKLVTMQSDLGRHSAAEFTRGGALLRMPGFQHANDVGQAESARTQQHE